MLPLVDVEIDDDILIPCPNVEFQNRRASKSCPDCPDFRGVFKKGDNGIWRLDYGILCGGAVERNTFVSPAVVED